MMKKFVAHFRILLLAVSALVSVSGASITLLEQSTHLGTGAPEWSIFEGTKRLEEPRWSAVFNATPNEREHTLIIRQDDVKQDWTITLNKKPIGSLFLMEADLVHTVRIPVNALREGENELHIYSKVPDDIILHSISIHDDAKTNMFNAGPLRIEVTDTNNATLPARITLIDENGSLAAFVAQGETNVAPRPGVLYTPDGKGMISVRPGTYTIFATRGPEYSLAREVVTISDEEVPVRLTLEREVKTTGWVASDTHIHTLTLSRHGDALLNERLITLAAEGIELPIATEHNLHADYATNAKGLALDKYFTAVPGNEVTTKRGHFNIFPVSLRSRPVDHNVEEWPLLLQSIRQSPLVRMVILNHPTDVHSGFTPFASTNFNRVTGKNLRGDFAFTFDGVEVINSGAMRSDWMEPFHCWFALLNRGLKVTGVGSSDSHDVSRFIVGQGRTYIRGEDSDPSRLNVAQLSDHLRQGRAIVSLGLFPQLSIADAPDALDAPSLTTGLIHPNSSHPGDLHQGESRFFEITASVDFPTWMNPEVRTLATLYENGKPKLVFPFEMKKTAGRPLAFKARFPKPKADAWYVLVAETPGMTNAYWSVARPYQPSSPEWKPAMIGATNPIYLDANGDGFYSAPRQIALHLNEKFVSPHDLIPALDNYDWAISAQVAEILTESGTDLSAAEFRTAITRAAPHVQQAFSDYLATVKK
jgi:hypothetical protein